MILESLQPGDLDHLVLPLLSIDEFSSKIDDARAIVVGWYCTDRDPATDLMKFIEGSNLPFLDTEVSPAPTPDGYYLLFVEISRNQDFINTLTEILHQVSNLVDNEWQMKVWGHTDIVDISKDNIKEYVNLNPNAVKSTDEEESSNIEPEDESPQITGPAEVSEEPSEEDKLEEQGFWNDASVDSIMLTESHIQFTGMGSVITLVKPVVQITEFGKLILDESRDATILQSMLGRDYYVWSYENAIVIQHGDSQVALKFF